MIQEYVQKDVKLTVPNLSTPSTLGCEILPKQGVLSPWESKGCDIPRPNEKKKYTVRISSSESSRSSCICDSLRVCVGVGDCKIGQTYVDMTTSVKFDLSLKFD